MFRVASSSSMPSVMASPSDSAKDMARDSPAAVLAIVLVTTIETAKHISAANAKSDDDGANAARYKTPILPAHAVSALLITGSMHELTSAGRPRLAMDANSAP